MSTNPATQSDLERALLAFRDAGSREVLMVLAEPLKARPWTDEQRAELKAALNRRHRELEPKRPITINEQG